jgi:alkylhydroperoxidase/carboxymuconolactone decarboxylase family protein YurZ
MRVDGSGPINATGGGAARRARAQGPRTDAVQAVSASLDPQLPEWIDEFIFGAVWGRPGLSHQERALTAITALATGQHTDQLRVYIWGALHDGVPARKIQEVLVMISIYAGFPVALKSLFVWRDILKSAPDQGIDIGDLG